MRICHYSQGEVYQKKLGTALEQPIPVERGALLNICHAIQVTDVL